MKRILSLLLCMIMLLAAASGCAGRKEPGADSVPGKEQTDNPGSGEEETPGGGEAGEAEPEKKFEFRPKVWSVYLDEIYGEKFKQAWFSMVDALMAGEDTFECADQETYDWLVFQFPGRLFPVMNEIIEPYYGYTLEDGKGRFTYKVTPEEAERKIDEFAELVERILNDSMKEYYTDMEKALALYSYFSLNYEYDYDTYDRMRDHVVDYTSAYRFLTLGTGICQECATAYSYLLMQAGVEATIMMGDSEIQDTGHCWSYVRINGNNYHIDPTYVMGNGNWLEYFMMNDEKRSEEYLPENYVIASNYTQEHDCPAYSADDDTFREIWLTTLLEFDHGTHILRSGGYDENGDPVTVEFDYAGF